MKHTVGKIEDFPSGKRVTVELEGIKILVVNQRGTFYAVEDVCTHMGAPLSTGYLGKKSITCEWHGAEFDMETGEALCGPAKLPVRSFPIRNNNGTVELEI